MTWLGYPPPFASGCEAVHFASCGLGAVETGVGGLGLGGFQMEKRTWIQEFQWYIISQEDMT